ncbi:MAG: hypothetical protein QOF74_8529 [Caballeronia mineralivorans]|jgi:hypothetical protein|nr:hypothetical protein [Caballeronia mineralivorans]
MAVLREKSVESSSVRLRGFTRFGALSFASNEMLPVRA